MNIILMPQTPTQIINIVISFTHNTLLNSSLSHDITQPKANWKTCTSTILFSPWQQGLRGNCSRLTNDLIWNLNPIICSYLVDKQVYALTEAWQWSITPSSSQSLIFIQWHLASYIVTTSDNSNYHSYINVILHHTGVRFILLIWKCHFSYFSKLSFKLLTLRIPTIFPHRDIYHRAENLSITVIIIILLVFYSIME